ncbi:hypothetical protein Tco_0200813 [Tanacetum coccineum]
MSCCDQVRLILISSCLCMYSKPGAYSLVGFKWITSSADSLEVYLPPSKLVFKYENQEWIQNEVNEVVGHAELLFLEILNALTQVVSHSGLKQALHVLIIAGASEVGTQRRDGQRFKCKGASKEEIDEFLETVEAKDGPMSMVKV